MEIDNGPIGIPITKEGIAFFSKKYFGVRICSMVMGYVPEPTPPDGPYHGGPRQKPVPQKKKIVVQKPPFLRLVT